MKPRRRAFPSLLALDLGEGRLFLGRFDEAALRRELEDEGIFRALAARGHHELILRTSFESGEHRLSVRPRGGRTSLVDLRLLETTVAVTEEVVRRGGLEVLSVLFNAWLSLQDPRAAFRFLSPLEQGRFEALRRDLAGLSVAQASAAVAEGRVRDLSEAQPLVWHPGLMVAAVSAQLARILDGEDYRRAALEARVARFALGY